MFLLDSNNLDPERLMVVLSSRALELSAMRFEEWERLEFYERDMKFSTVLKMVECFLKDNFLQHKGYYCLWLGRQFYTDELVFKFIELSGSSDSEFKYNLLMKLLTRYSPENLEN